ncbi:MAG: LacI family DNA-binding transcriptional regulator [Mycobacteriales bacterium]
MTEPPLDGTKRERRPGSIEVARLAGVSHQTVSRVLNNHPNVRETTRARVTAAIKVLDYRRNLAARALATGRTQTLGVVSFDTTLYGPASTVYGIEQAARAAGYFVTISSLRSIDRASILDALDRLKSQSVDGIIVISPQKQAVQALEDLPTGVPVVAIGGGSEYAVPMATIDQRAGTELATQHLLDNGHATVWHVAGPPDWLEAEARLESWQATLERAGADVPQPIVGDWTARSGYQAGRIMARVTGLTAVYAANDHMALGVLCALTEAGLRVPEDVSIVGFDDVPEAEFFSPPLTTVRQDFGELGRRSIAMLLAQLSGRADALPAPVVPTQLILRKSVSAVR